jgi:hypothetical protein
LSSGVDAEVGRGWHDGGRALAFDHDLVSRCLRTRDGLINLGLTKPKPSQIANASTRINLLEGLIDTAFNDDFVSREFLIKLAFKFTPGNGISSKAANASSRTAKVHGRSANNRNGAIANRAYACSATLRSCACARASFRGCTATGPEKFAAEV